MIAAQEVAKIQIGATGRRLRFAMIEEDPETSEMEAWIGHFIQDPRVGLI